MYLIDQKNIKIENDALYVDDAPLINLSILRNIQIKKPSNV
jgi:hypothetical protein